MKAILINGSPHKNGTTFTALSRLAGFLELRGIDSDIISIGTNNNECIGCWKCKETGLCVFKDEVNNLIKTVDQYSALIVGSPVYYAAPTGGIISFLDRLFQAAHKKLEYKIAASIAVARRAGTTTTIDVLNKYFLYNNMPIIPSNYWNGAFGMNGEELQNDIEGISILENLSDNTLWLLQSLMVAQANQIALPTAKEKFYLRKRN